MSTILNFEHPSSLQHWETVDDVVMGGLSNSQVHWLDRDPQPGALRFEGQVSLDHNGGFCSTKNHGHWDLSKARCVVWTVRGTERDFLATIRDANTPQGASFRHPFRPSQQTWTDQVLPLEEFRLFRRGTKVSDQARIDSSDIRSFGFLLADGNAGDFHLDVTKCRATY